MSTPLFQLDGVCYRYRQGAPYAVEALTLTIEAGQRTAIVGANGSGKSTTLMLMKGLFRPECGKVRYRGRPVYERSKADRRAPVLPEVGIAFQEPDDQLISLTVWEDVLFTPLQLGLPLEEAEERARWALSTLSISHLADRPPHALSYGQKKLVAIAGVLAARPETILFDEPTAFLDPAGRRRIHAVLETLGEQGVQLIVATHDMQFVADWADRVVVLKEGRLLGHWTPEAFFADGEKVEAASLERPPVAELIADLYDGASGSLPIRTDAAREWLRAKLSAPKRASIEPSL
ncbi:MAG: energy-coupling factor ABC transporter ATP-binding protein [Hydrogenibacillus schlegelii]|uniref:Energy-coupling factor ABC transporter ATP-binding protein n=1 Tax=Hydrogenibacillus schlegelii TaxID=1484 RepID=A0A947D392_HYDSH|nr:energy-coupling factor ABC transporter ATP-binding protein [Hydrogenibacillus schlegelii]